MDYDYEELFYELVRVIAVEHFRGDRNKADAWMTADLPMLGNVTVRESKPEPLIKFLEGALRDNRFDQNRYETLQIKYKELLEKKE